MLDSLKQRPLTQICRWYKLHQVTRYVRYCILCMQGHNATWLRNIAQNESVTISTPFQCSTAQTVHPGQMATATTASYPAPGNSTAVQFVCSVPTPAPICSNLQVCPAGGLQTLRSSQVSLDLTVPHRQACRFHLCTVCRPCVVSSGQEP